MFPPKGFCCKRLTHVNRALEPFYVLHQMGGCLMRRSGPSGSIRNCSEFVDTPLCTGKLGHRRQQHRRISVDHFVFFILHNDNDHQFCCGSNILMSCLSKIECPIPVPRIDETERRVVFPVVCTKSEGKVRKCRFRLFAHEFLPISEPADIFPGISVYRGPAARVYRSARSGRIQHHCHGLPDQDFGRSSLVLVMHRVHNSSVIPLTAVYKVSKRLLAEALVPCGYLYIHAMHFRAWAGGGRVPINLSGSRA